MLAGSPEFGAGRLVYGLEYQHSDGPWDNPNRFTRRTACCATRRAARPTASIHRHGLSRSWNSTDQIPQRAVDAGLIGLSAPSIRPTAARSERYSLSGEWRQSEGGINRAASVYLIRSRLNLFSNFTFFLDDPVNGDQFEQAEKRLVAGGSASQTWFLKSGERQIWNTLGAQVRRDRIEPVGLYSTVARERLATTREDDVTVTSVAPYFSNTIAWTSWFRTIAGLRADYVDMDVASDNPANSGKAHDFLWSPKLSLVFGPWAKTEYFVNIGRGFHSNDARGTTITIDPKTGAPADRVDPLVQTFGYEGGVRSELAKGLTARPRCGSSSRIPSCCSWAMPGPPSRAGRRGATGWSCSRSDLPKPGLALDLSLAFTHARFRDDDPAGNYIPGAPDRVASAGVTLESGYGWFGALRWRYFGPRPLIEDNSVRSKSTSLVNARAGYAFSKTMKLQLDVFNLFDRKDHDIDYFYESRLPGEPAPVADVHFHPVEKRAVRATLDRGLLRPFAWVMRDSDEKG